MNVIALWEILIIAVGLSMDSFAVAITLGLSVKKPTLAQYAIPGMYFGFFHIVIPLIGFFSGRLFAERIQSFDHWVAFALLAFVGGKMIKEAFSKEEDKLREDPFRFINMLLLSIATSMDALAVGITFALFEINIFIAVAITGFTAGVISTGGVKVGNIFGTKFKSKAEFAGGLILVLIGLRILVADLFFNKG